jgi:hypothetical protein
VVEADAERLRRLAVAADVAAGQDPAASLVAYPGRGVIGRGGGVLDAVVADRDREQPDNTAEQRQEQDGLAEVADNGHALDPFLVVLGPGRLPFTARPQAGQEATASTIVIVGVGIRRARRSRSSRAASSGWSRRCRRAAWRPRPSGTLP